MPYLQSGATVIPVEPASYTESYEYPAETGVVFGSFHSDPVNGERIHRRLVSFETPFRERAETLALRDVLEAIPQTLSGTLLGGPAVATPASVQLVNHPEVLLYARLSCTFWLDPVSED